MRPRNRQAEAAGQSPLSHLLSSLRFVPLLFIVAGFVVVCASGWQHSFSLENLAHSQQDLSSESAAHPLLAPIAFFLFYAAAITLSMPGVTLLTLLSGAIFGWMLGGTIVVFAATAGGMIVYLCARTAFGELWRRRHDGKLARLAEGLRENAFGTIVVLRLAPMFPFFLINIGSGLLGVRARTFIVATFLGIIPETFVCAWLGRGIDSIMDAQQASGKPLSLADLLSPEIVAGLALLMLAAAIPMIVKILRNRSRNRRDERREVMPDGDYGEHLLPGPQ